MERHNGKLYRVMYFYNTKYKTYTKSKFIKEVEQKAAVKRGPKPKSSKPVKTRTRSAPVKESVPAPVETRRPIRAPTMEDAKRSQFGNSIGRSTASDSLINDYSRLGRR